MFKKMLILVSLMLLSGLGVVNVQGQDYVCGDANADGVTNVSDAVYLISYIFKGGAPPMPLEAGDANCDGRCNLSDAYYIIHWVFTGGNDPCDPNGDGIPDC